MWLQLMRNTDGVMGNLIRSCDFMPTFKTFVSKPKMAAYVNKDTFHEVSVFIFSTIMIF